MIILNNNYVFNFSRRDVSVYLGFSRNPYHQHNRHDPNGQIIQAEKIFMHEEFGFIEINEQYLNNLALIRLQRNIRITATVRPIPIASPEDFPIPPGTFINQTGFESLKIDGPLRYATVQENYPKMCNVFYGNTLLPIQERCVRQEGVERNRWVGPYVVDGLLIGFHRSISANTSCHVTTPPCDNHDVYINLEPALLWIYKASGISSGNHFEGCNPYWDKTKEISTIVTQTHRSQKKKHRRPNRYSNVLDDVHQGIHEGLKPSLCKK